ncbi:GspH/FimT family pseudopilin [Variovorax sp. DT-64]|uniref:GspH/FimT family pseudopilin n=1 Tax=Variovorax sp. DT-64 TaxID=3396160 RepID=UPI003F1C2C7F
MISKRSHEIEGGFTLIELMVTLAVAAILLVIAVPGFMAFQRNAELTSTTNRLISAIATVRSEAMKTGMAAMLVPADGTKWTNGWIAFIDENRDQKFTVDDKKIIFTQAPLASYLTANANGTGNASPPYIMFDASGYPKTIGGGFGGLTITIAPSDLTGAAALTDTRSVIISLAGRVRSCRPVSAPDAKCHISTDPDSSDSD